MAIGEAPSELIDEAIIGSWLDDLETVSSQCWCRARRDDPESMRAGAPSLDISRNNSRTLKRAERHERHASFRFYLREEKKELSKR